MESAASSFTQDVKHGFLGLLDFGSEVFALSVFDQKPFLVTHIRLSQKFIQIFALVDGLVSCDSSVRLLVDVELFSSISS